LEIHNADGTLRATITPSDGSLDAIAAAINKAPEAGVQAAVVQVRSGVYRLQITSTTTGTAGDFQLTGPAGTPLQSGGGNLTFATVTDADDAAVHVGPAGAGYDVKSSSNTIEGLMPGVTVRLNEVADSVTVTARRDPDATAAVVQSFVDSANAVLKAIRDASSAGVTLADGTRSGQGPLAASGLMRDLTSRVISAVSNAVGGSSAGSLGLTVAKDGVLEFDKSKLVAQLNADPTGVRAVFAPDAPGVGVASRVADVANGATASGVGTITLAIAGQNDQIRDLNDRIADWDVRLQLRKATLQRTYSALEVALSGLKSQSSWLAGQINSLPSSSGSN
jgi:flagellar hook-associated protein 2